MSLFVLDTDTISILAEGHASLELQIANQDSRLIATTIISVEEILSGWYRLLRQTKEDKQLAEIYQELADAVRLVGRWQILSFTETAMARFAQLKALKLNIGSMDLRIAAITLESGGILVTRNLRDFQRVPNLPLVNWVT